MKNLAAALGIFVAGVITGGLMTPDREPPPRPPAPVSRSAPAEPVPIAETAPAPEPVPPEVPKLLAEKDWWSRHQAVSRIREQRLVEHLADVTVMLSDEHLDESAAATLGELGDARSIEALRTAYATGDLGLKRAAAEALQKLGDGAAITDFLNVAYVQMRTDPDGALRLEAARQLGQLFDRTTVPMLAEALADSNSMVRTEAARALGEIGDPAAVPALEQSLADPIKTVRETAQNSIEYIHDPSKRPTAITLWATTMGVSTDGKVTFHYVAPE